jgi:exodeoxyribonuclease V beta subunit
MGAAAAAAAAAAAISEERPEAVAALDLSKPGLLEASAGTGKTYAIEHLVLRILIETETIELPQILVLTFTEKATGELKDKIRARIAWRIAQGGLPAKVMDRLRRAHLEFDRASIHTIHGFCQKVLRKYAFENNALFRQDLLKDVDTALEQVLYEEMRSTWLAGGPEGLAEFRDKAESLGLGAKTKWQRRITDIAKGFNPLRGDVLLPEYHADRVAQWEAGMGEAFAGITALLPDLAPGNEAEHPFAKRFAALKFASPVTRKKGLQIVIAALRLAAICASHADPQARALAAASFPARIEEIGLTGVNKDGFRFLLPGPGESKEPWPELETFLELLDRVRSADIRIRLEQAARAFGPRREVILEVRKKAQARLRAEGQITYDSMIEDVCLALRQKDERVRMLRRDYRYCLVDEFQDTDPLQWEIFRRVFLDSGSANPLYLIGDPKQAIYRFRGGDVYTYMEARKLMFALSREGKAQGLGLDTNYRSSGAMVEAYNAAFTHRSWFHAHPVDPADPSWRLPAEPDPLGYVPVKYGALAVQKPADATDAPKPIVLKDFAVGDPDRNAVKKRVNHWIVAEIAALMADPNRLGIPDKANGGFRPLAWGDICVLVRKSREKDQLLRMLAEAGIPAQVARRVGLYAGDAAGQYLAVLESLEDPGDSGKHARALLTRFFRAEGDAPPARPPESPHPLFEEWIRLAERRRWPRLFHSLQYRSGLLYRESLRGDADRSIMDFIHVGQNLVQEAVRENFNLAALVQRLKDLRAATAGADEDADMHREESEGGKVVLMTMHVSKGLEFPVVFLANFSGNPKPTYFKYRDGLNTVYHLDTKDETAKRAYQEESEGEDRRLYYVALTRARYKLYVPLLPAGSGNSATGPLGGFVAESLRTAAALRPDLYHFAPPEAYDRPLTPIAPIAPIASIARFSGSAQVPAPSAPFSAPSAAIPQFDDAADSPGAVDAFLSDFPREDRLARPDADFSRRRRRLASYSHLVRQGHGLSSENVEGRFDKEEAPVTDMLPERETDAEDTVPQATGGPGEESPTFPGNALPRGKDVGNMFHEILERIDFGAAGGAASPGGLFDHRPTGDLIEACMADHRLGPEWRDGVAAVLWNTLRAPLPDPAGGAPFPLCEVDQAQRRPEMEFLFPYPARQGASGPDGYLWGFIDLVYRHRGRYYLLDWKSNHLDGYGSADLDRSMRESHYDLQYMLYSLALDKWLASLIPDYRYADHFGGIHYLFLRGMRAGLPSTKASGVFSLKPAHAQITGEFPARLARYLGASGFAGPSEAALIQAVLDRPEARAAGFQGGKDRK